MPGKGNPLLSVRIPPDLDTDLKTRTDETGESRSDITIAALLAYLQPPQALLDVSDLRRRVELLERQATPNRKL